MKYQLKYKKYIYSLYNTESNGLHDCITMHVKLIVNGPAVSHIQGDTGAILGQYLTWDGGKPLLYISKGQVAKAIKNVPSSLPLHL